MTNYETIKTELPNDVTLCVVTKKHSIKEMMYFYNKNERIFAESRAQELQQKYLLLPDDIEWQFIGHLQRNKVKDVVPLVSCIQSLDSLRLAKEIEKQCKKFHKTMPCLVEFHLAKNDENKTGLKKEDAFAFFDEVRKYKHIELKGIMVMGPHTDDEEEIRSVFKDAKQLFDSLQQRYGESITTLSMGMSKDYNLAIEEGSTMVRIGTRLFEDLEME